jgi:ABC-type cobalamin/Fe3+-siderophores transport system ATPase subunit
MDLCTALVEDVIRIRGISFPAEVRFRQLLITGPPGSGKSTLIGEIRGWPEEGYIDLAQKGWWRSPSLNFRPREVHFGLPFQGHRESLAVFEPQWLESPSPIDFERVQIPPAKRNIFSANWRNRYVFEFQLAPAERIHAVRTTRAYRATHPVDAQLTLAHVRLQLEAYQQIAYYFHVSGMRVFIRNLFENKPRRIVEPRSGS